MWQTQPFSRTFLVNGFDIISKTPFRELQVVFIFSNILTQNKMLLALGSSSLRENSSIVI
jgi:hypothetical protein